jgi:putative transposase
MIAAAEALGQEIGVAQACRVLGVARSSLYRSRQVPPVPKPRPTPARALSAVEWAEMRAVLNSARFYDSPPRQVYATLLDADGVYLCHWRTMYRVLEEPASDPEGQKRHRNANRTKPELCATGARQVWSWDITQLKGAEGIFYLYKVIDVFSRYIVGWLVAAHERGELAEQLIAATCRKQGIGVQQLTLHADHGSAMRAKVLKDMLTELGVTESHSRPYTPTDNPYSEAEFKTMKYRPDYPEQFRDRAEARQWVQGFVQWYNHAHYHSGLALLTPATVHHGAVAAVLEHRQQALDAAYAAHPERFVDGPPIHPAPPAEVWINQPGQPSTSPTLSSGAVTTDSKPGAQAESRESAATLDADEHLATIGGSLPRRRAAAAFSRFNSERELSQSH